MRNIRLGKAFGIDVYVHWTFILIPGWVFFHHVAQGEPALAAYLAAMVLVIFGCVLLHEFGHALMARRFGISTQDITLYPIGGVARLSRMSDRPWEEFWISLAGPAVNVVIAAVTFTLVLVGCLAVSPEQFVRSTPVGMFLVHLLLANVLLVVFNLLPAFPMDGGRVVRALLAARLGLLRGTELAAYLGAVMSALFIFGGMLGLVRQFQGAPTFLSPMLLVIGVFVFFLGQRELAAVRRREAARRAEPIDVLPADGPVGDGPGLPGDAPVTGFRWESRAGLWVLWYNGRPIRVLVMRPN